MEVIHATGAPECIAGGDEDPEAILDEPEADFRQVGALSDAVHADECDAVRQALLRRRQGRRELRADRQQEVRRRLRRQDARERVRERLAHRRVRRCRTLPSVSRARSMRGEVLTLEPADLLAYEAFSNALAHLLRDLLRHVLLHQVLLHGLEHRLQVLLRQHLRPGEPREDGAEGPQRPSTCRRLRA